MSTNRFTRLAGPLKHVLDQIDAPARTIALIPEQHVGGAHRCTKPAMDAPADNTIGFRDARVVKLFRGEVRLH
jgi:hypothetical protein